MNHTQGEHPDSRFTGDNPWQSKLFQDESTREEREELRDAQLEVDDAREALEYAEIDMQHAAKNFVDANNRLTSAKWMRDQILKNYKIKKNG